MRKPEAKAVRQPKKKLLCVRTNLRAGYSKVLPKLVGDSGFGP